MSKDRRKPNKRVNPEVMRNINKSMDVLIGAPEIITTRRDNTKPRSMHYDLLYLYARIKEKDRTWRAKLDPWYGRKIIINKIDAFFMFYGTAGVVLNFDILKYLKDLGIPKNPKRQLEFFLLFFDETVRRLETRGIRLFPPPSSITIPRYGNLRSL